MLRKTEKKVLKVLGEFCKNKSKHKKEVKVNLFSNERSS